MQKTKKILLIALIIFLSGCDVDPLEDEQCYLLLKINQTTDEFFVLRKDENYCGCRTYVLSKDYIGAKTSFKEMPLGYCSNIVGRKNIKDGPYSRLAKWREEIRQKYLDSQE